MSSVATFVTTYGIQIWVDALQSQESSWKIASVYHLIALRVASAYCTVSEEVAFVIARTLPIQGLAENQRYICRWKRDTTLNPEDLRI